MGRRSHRLGSVGHPATYSLDPPAHSSTSFIPSIRVLPFRYRPCLAARPAAAAWVADWTDWWGRGGATTEREGWLVKTLIGPLEQVFEEKATPACRRNRRHFPRARPARRGHGYQRQGHPLPAAGCGPSIDSQYARRRLARDKVRSRCRPAVMWATSAISINATPTCCSRRSDACKASDARLLMVGDPGCRVPEGLRERVTITGRLPFEACSITCRPAMCWRCLCRIRLPIVAAGRRRSTSSSPWDDPPSPATSATWPDLLRDNDIGLLVRPEASEFAARIDELLADPARAEAMGDRAREVARDDLLAGRDRRQAGSFLSQDSLPARKARALRGHDVQHSETCADHRWLRLRRSTHDPAAAAGGLLALDRRRSLDRSALRRMAARRREAPRSSPRASIEYDGGRVIFVHGDARDFFSGRTELGPAQGAGVR